MAVVPSTLSTNLTHLSKFELQSWRQNLLDSGLANALLVWKFPRQTGHIFVQGDVAPLGTGSKIEDFFLV